MATERRKGERVTFERGFPAHMMGIDGTWAARLYVGGRLRDRRQADGRGVGRRPASEGVFSVVIFDGAGLPSMRIGVGQRQIGVNFLKQGDKKKKAAAAKRGAQAAEA